MFSEQHVILVGVVGDDRACWAYTLFPNRFSHVIFCRRLPVKLKVSITTLRLIYACHATIYARNCLHIGYLIPIPLLMLTKVIYGQRRPRSKLNRARGSTKVRTLYRNRDVILTYSLEYAGRDYSSVRIVQRC